MRFLIFKEDQRRGNFPSMISMTRRKLGHKINANLGKSILLMAEETGVVCAGTKLTLLLKEKPVRF